MFSKSCGDDSSYCCRPLLQTYFYHNVEIKSRVCVGLFCQRDNIITKSLLFLFLQERQHDFSFFEHRTHVGVLVYTHTGTLFCGLVSVYIYEHTEQILSRGSPPTVVCVCARKHKGGGGGVNKRHSLLKTFIHRCVIYHADECIDILRFIIHK